MESFREQLLVAQKVGHRQELRAGVRRGATLGPALALQRGHLGAAGLTVIVTVTILSHLSTSGRLCPRGPHHQGPRGTPCSGPGRSA